MDLKPGNMAGDYWLRDVVQLERQVLASGGGAPPADAFTINGHPGPNYNCSSNGKKHIYDCSMISKMDKIGQQRDIEEG